MTSFIIKAHVDRAPNATWSQPPDCTFCSILNGELPAYRVYEDDKVIAILDIMPLRPGHTLVIPKAHYSRLSDLPPEYAASVGVAVSKVAHALTLSLNNTALNVVCNQEYAQAVPHVHYHIIPAPTFGAKANENDTEPTTPTTVAIQEKSSKDPPPTIRQMHQMEFVSRGQLDEEEAQLLVSKIRAKL